MDVPKSYRLRVKVKEATVYIFPIAHFSRVCLLPYDLF